MSEDQVVFCRDILEAGNLSDEWGPMGFRWGYAIPWGRGIKWFIAVPEWKKSPKKDREKFLVGKVIVRKPTKGI